MEDRRLNHLLYQLMQQSKAYGLGKAVAANYDKLVQQDDRTKSPLLWDLFTHCNFFHPSNRAFLKRSFKIKTIVYSYTGDKDEPDTFTHIFTWAKQPIPNAFPDDWYTLCCMEIILKMMLTQFNCCDTVSNPDPEFAKTFGQPTPESWAFDNGSTLTETEDSYLMELTFHGHYHS